MTQQLIKVPPTKNTLLRLKKQVQFLDEGHDLLERKRELLTRLVYERIGEYRRLRAEAETLLEGAYRCLSITHLRMGSRGIHQAALGAQPAIKADILPRRSLGIEYPAVSAERVPLNPVGLLGTDASFDNTRDHLADLAVVLAHLGEVEIALHRLLAAASALIAVWTNASISLACAIVALLFAYARQILMPKINDARDAQMQGDRKAGRQFKRLHLQSVIVNGLQFLILLAVAASLLWFV